MTNWYKVRELVDLKILDIPMDGNHGEIHPISKDFVKEGIPFIMSSDINNGNVDFKNCKFLSKKQTLKLRKGFSLYGDVLLTHKASIGRTAINKFKDDEFIMLTPQVTYYRIINDNKLNNKFLKYYFDSSFFQTTIKAWSDAGSTRAYIGITKQLDLPIYLPKIESQQKIADVLSLLDDKIELNNKINIELEQMAKTLYDYWFVQFDFPDANGKPYKSSGRKMVWNEELKREIPEGWAVKTLLDIANFVNGLACQKFRPNENEDSYRVIKIREMGTGFTENSEFVSKKIPEKVVVENGDILFSWSATLDVKMWTGGRGALNQHIFKITSNDFPKSYYFFELLNYLQHFKMQAELRKTTMGHITQDHLKQSRITNPPMDLINKLDGIIKPILEKKVKLEEENQELSKLRDWLLPMLMNGQVTVGDAEEMVGNELNMVAEGDVEYKKN